MLYSTMLSAYQAISCWRVRRLVDDKFARNLDRSLIEILSQHLPRHEGRRLDSPGSHWDFLLGVKGDCCVRLTTLPP